MVGEAERILDGIERLTGGRPPSCPWRAFRDPFVREVIDLYRAAGGLTEGGAVPAHVLGMDPPHAVWRGLLHYVQAVALVRADRQRRDREERERQSRLRGAMLDRPRSRGR